MDAEERIARAAYLTKIIRVPKQHLTTFGASKLTYYVITEPTYQELALDEEESVIRQGSKRPELVTPHYMLN